MKILLTVEFYWPHMGGAEEVSRRIAEGLAARGHTVHVATGRDPNRKSEFHNGVSLHEFAVGGNEVKGLSGDVQAYREFLRGFDCDILLNYAAQSWATDIAMQELGRLAARHAVLVACGYSGLSTPLRRLAYRQYFARLPERLHQYDLVIYHAEQLRDAEFGRRHGVTRFRVIGNGVNAREFALPRGRFRQAQGLGDRPLLVNVSNHYLLKGHDRFARLAHAMGGRAAAVLLGRNAAPAWQNCYPLCLATGAAGVFRVLDGARGTVVSAMRDADLVVFTSRSEVAPLVLLEAAAAATPWVSFDVGNARELGGGLVVTSQAELVEAVRRLLDNPAERERLAADGLEFARQHHWERKIDAYEAALTELLSAPRELAHAA